MTFFIDGYEKLPGWLIPSTIIIGVLLWRYLKRYPTKIIMQSTSENRFLVDNCPSFKEYRPTPWLFNGHLSTVFSVKFRTLPTINFERVILPVDERGGTIAMDWNERPRPSQPILLILHGLTGGSHNPYVRWMVKIASSRLNICCVVAHARGCGNSKLTSPQSFCAAHTDDIRKAVKYIRSLIDEQTPIFAVGYSLGAGTLTKYLGEEGEQCPLKGAVICCASYDMHKTTQKLESTFYHNLYNQTLTKNLIDYLRSHEEQFTRKDSDVNLNLASAYQSRTIREYDHHVIIPQYGFRSVSHFYDEASPKCFLESIRIPSLILSAIDDPICPIEGLPFEHVQNNSFLIGLLTSEGGHVSHAQGWWPTSISYDNIVAVDFIRARLKQINYTWDSEKNRASVIDVRIRNE